MELTEGMKRGILSAMHAIQCTECGCEQKEMCNKANECLLLVYLLGY